MSAGAVIGDWGNTRLRLWRLGERGDPECREGAGIALTNDPSATLLATLDDWRPCRITLCGMAGARNGLHEVGYVECPVSASEWAAGTTRLDFHGVPLRIAGGIACRDGAGRPDVMRGEETQMFGALALDPSLADGTHVVLLPGTHSKWLRLVDGYVTGFRTFLTGELFGLLGGSSLFAAGGDSGEGEDVGFADGLERAAEGAATSALFEARSRQLCDSRSAGWARGFVSGLLIGCEANAMAPAMPTLIIGEPELAARYRVALGQPAARVADAEACTIAGLRMLDERD